MDLQPVNNDNNFTFRERHMHRFDILEDAILAIGGFVIAMLAFRFILALLGANPDNGFANFVYSFTEPLTAPFYNLFSYDHPSLGVSQFQGYTLVTMVVYGAVTTGFARLVSIFRYH